MPKGNTVKSQLICTLVLVLLGGSNLSAQTAFNFSFGNEQGGRLIVQAGQFQTGQDKALNAFFVAGVGKTPLSLQSPLEEGPRVMRALVRYRGEFSAAPFASFTIMKDARDAKNAGLRMSLSTRKDGEFIQCHVTQNGKPLHDAKALAQKLDWLPMVSNSLNYYPRAYPLSDIRPGWPEDFRIRVEQDMTALPGINDRWLAIRIEVKDGQFRCWLDDRLVAHKSDPSISAKGLTNITLSPGVQLAGYEVVPWREAAGFLPIHLDGYNNGRTFLGSSVMPGSHPAGKPAMIDGIPFVFSRLTPDGKDHIDVSKSFLRQANMEGYLQSLGHRSVGAARRDPARIQLRIPNGHYDALYLVAAAGGEPNTIPQVTAMFYRPSAGFAECFEATVPLATATSAAAAKVPVKLANGKSANLWLIKIPLDPGRLASFSDLDVVEIELTKKVHLYRTYPDPINYGYHQGGLPSSVHVFAATLGESPFTFELIPQKFGHVWTNPEVPAYTLRVKGRDPARNLAGAIKIQTRSYDGTETHQATLSGVGTWETVQSFPVKLNGLHTIEATLVHGGRSWTEKRSFVRLAPDTRATKWTEGKGALFGYWSYHGGHHCPKAEHDVELMTRAGARTSGSVTPAMAEHPLVKKHWAPAQAGAFEVRLQAWARQEPYDPKKYAEYQQQVVAAFTKARNKLPPEFRPDHVYFFPEPHISSRLTEGNLSSYWGEMEPPLSDQEKTSLRMYMVTAKCAAEAVRKEYPNLKILIPWGDPLFIPPILRAGFPKELIDGSGLDIPGFERLPEMQLHQNAIHRLYTLRKEFEKAGIPNAVLQYVEGIFVPTEPGAVTPREQMDIYSRWTLLSMAYGIDRFYSGWFAFDCGNYYGSEHYGGCGIQRRIPYCDPKPAYAAYATMTDRLNEANFDGWLKTGSNTTYCLRFAGPKGKVHTLWTLRGKRPVTLTLASDGDVQVTDSMNNTVVIKTRDRQATISTDPSVVYVSATAAVVSALVGEPDHSDARPAEDKLAKVVGDLGDGTWSFSNQRDKVYEEGNFAMSRYPGKFSTTLAVDRKDMGKVLVSRLEKQEKVHELMPWYNVLTPKKKIVLPGAPQHLGLWVKGASDWGRVIYVLRDAKGEKWTSIGAQDQYNCDDTHSWSSFNFDGWRYLRFELPGHTPYDSYRKHGTTWWRSDGGDGIVDLPLTLESIIVEQRSHLLYVNDVQPAASDTVCFGKLYAEYASTADEAPLAVAQAKLRMPLPKGAPDLPNPIVLMEKEGTSAPTKILRLEPPLEHNDGTMVHVHFNEVQTAKKHFVWVGIRPDGKGAVNLTPKGAKNGAPVRGLRPALPLYFWVTYVDAQGRQSRPSQPMNATLVDTFSQK
jgi:hypothetical protein